MIILDEMILNNIAYRAALATAGLLKSETRRSLIKSCCQ